MLLKNAQPIVTNAEGARKTPSAIAFRDGTILYGVQALSSQARFPDQTFVHTNQMLGRAGDPSSGGPSWFGRHGYRYSWQTDRRGGARVAACCPELSMPAEVLSGLLLAHVGEMISAQLADSGDLETTHIALAVPSGWNARQREALLDAASIATLGGSSAQVELVNSHVAAAFKYAMNLRLLQNEPEAVTKAAHVALIVDAGSAYVTASVISVQAVRKGSGKKSNIVERLRYIDPTTFSTHSFFLTLQLRYIRELMYCCGRFLCLFCHQSLGLAYFRYTCDCQ
jgi:molecular chaperone DnaK (HSP70)